MTRSNGSGIRLLASDRAAISGSLVRRQPSTDRSATALFPTHLTIRKRGAKLSLKFQIPEPTMQPIRKESITEQVYEIVQREIEAGRIKPGERIYEQQLAEQLSISKTPLRLALHQLKQDGIVRIEPRQGIYLAAPSLDQVYELIEMREVLEGLAARRAASARKRAFTDQMKTCLAGFTHENVNQRRSKYANADHRFHRLLVRASASNELIRSLEKINLRLHMNRLRLLFSRGHDLRPIHDEHLAILAALEAGDSRKAEQLVRSHVRNIPWQAVVHSGGAAATASPDAA
jgi:DNA-binding GntR family transcriptional regulator